MPSYPVLQPNGQFAIWSTVVDDFTALNLSKAEAMQFLEERHNYSDLPRFMAELAQGALPLAWWDDWPDLVADALWRYGADNATVKEALELTPDPLMRRYIQASAALSKAEITADELRGRAEAAEAKLDAVPVAAIRQVFYAGRWKDQQEVFDKSYDIVDEWLAQQGEVQP